MAGVPDTFSIAGQNAAFLGGLQQVTIVTNAGRAVVTGLTPLSSATVQISVSTTFLGETAAATIAQSNVLTAAQAGACGAGTAGGSGAAPAGAGTSGGGLPSGVIVGAAAAAAAGALGIQGEDAPAAAPTRISISPSGGGIPGVTAFTFTVQGARRTVSLSQDGECRNEVPQGTVK